MKNLLLSVLAISLIGCGDDTKKSAATNVPSNNTTANNTTANNTTANNTSANNTSANNTTANNVSVPTLDLGPDTDPISSVDVVSACQETQAYFASNVSDAEIKEFGCLLSGAFSGAFGEFATDADVQGACQAAYDDCQTQPADPNPTDMCDLTPTDCTAKIGLVEDCIEAQVAGLKTVIDTFSCADLTLDSDPTSLSQTPSSCDQLETECPDFFGQEG